VNRADLISAAAERSGMARKDVEKAADAVFESIEEALSKGERVRLAGFGTFEVKKRAARKGRNPRTGEEIFIPEAKVPCFRAGRAVRDAVV